MIGTLKDGVLTLNEKEQAEFRKLWQDLSEHKQQVIRDVALHERCSLLTVYRKYEHLFEKKWDFKYDDDD